MESPMEHENIQRTREAYEAFANGDLAKVAEEFTPDVVWHVGGHSLLAGDYKGPTEIMGFFGRLFTMSEGTLKIDVQDILANDDRATVLVHMSAQRGRRILAQDAVHVFEFEDGKTREFWSFEEDQRAEDEFWS